MSIVSVLLESVAGCIFFQPEKKDKSACENSPLTVKINNSICPHHFIPTNRRKLSLNILQLSQFYQYVFNLELRLMYVCRQF